MFPRSSSEGSLPEASRSSENTLAVPNGQHSFPSKTSVMRFLSSKETSQLEEIRKAYSNVLYNWRLLNQRAEVQQYCSTALTSLKDAEFLSVCGECKQLLCSYYCPKCSKPAMSCSICQLSVRGELLCPNRYKSAIHAIL